MPTSELKKRIRNIPDFPRKGIQFKDITTLLSDPSSFQRAIDASLPAQPPSAGFT